MILQNNLSFLQNTFFVYKMRASVFLFLFLMAFFKSFGQPISIQIDSIISKDFRILHSSFPIATGSVRLYSLGINNENTIAIKRNS